MADDDNNDVSCDAILGGRLELRQPTRGYRAAIDPVLLAASLPDTLHGDLADLGCGVGTAGLCAAARLPGVRVVGVERDGAMAALAARNIAANNLNERMRVVAADIADAANAMKDRFNAVIVNPPYLQAERANTTRDESKATATIEKTPLHVWIDVALNLLVPRGRLAIIHRADRLADVLGCLARRAGDIVVFPLWPRSDQPAKRIIVSARLGVRTPLTLAPGLVLHEADGRYTKEADHVLRGGGLRLP